MNRQEFDRLHPAPHENGQLRLFKFRAFDVGNPALTTNIFERRELYFPQPNQLNDPWEGRTNVLPPASHEDLLAALNRLIDTGIGHDLSPDVAKQEAERILQDPERLQQVARTSVTQANQDVRICCFSAEKNNNLLWAHYADSYRGYCIEFSQGFPLYELAYRVHYQQDFPVFTYPHSIYDALHTILTKSADWSYENEYRALTVPNAEIGLNLEDGKYLLEDGAIGAVYFGPRMAEDHQNMIINAIVNGPFNPDLYRCRFRDDAFQLEYERLA